MVAIGTRSTAVNIKKNRTVPIIRSLYIIEGKNFTFSIFSWDPVGLEDPVECSIIKCNTADRTINKGTTKWSEKNRLSVGWDTEKFPQAHCTTELPM